MLYAQSCTERHRALRVVVVGQQVPITYTREMAWATELLRLLPTIGLIGLYIWFTRRQLGGGFGGGGGMGGRGIFNVGKAQVRRSAAAPGRCDDIQEHSLANYKYLQKNSKSSRPAMGYPTSADVCISG